MADDNEFFDTATDGWQDTEETQFTPHGAPQASGGLFADTGSDAWRDTSDTQFAPREGTPLVYLSPHHPSTLSITPRRRLIPLC